MILAFILVQERFTTRKTLVRLDPSESGQVIRVLGRLGLIQVTQNGHNLIKIISGLKIWPSREFGSGLNIKYSVISNTEPSDDKFVFQLDIENDSLQPLEFETDENAWEIHFRLVSTELFLPKNL